MIPRSRTSLPCVLPLVLLVSCTLVRGDDANPEGAFAREIEPIFRARCVTCHGEPKQKGGLRLDARGDALRGGDSGPVIVPGTASESPLIERVASDDPSLRMPPTGDRLAPSQIDSLKRWIDAGATWPETATTIDRRTEHWSFQPVKRPEPPAVKETNWPRNPIDRFILSRLEDAGLHPSPEADRRTLIRRLSFDLIGLPPRPDEVEAFVNDPAADAYERLVDRLLASPRFGERWARHWLDVVRFAESNGFEMNRPRPNAWPYRDYVIRAFNDDLPYDRFVREQLAGDTLGKDAATGFLVAGPWDEVKSPDPALTAMQRADELNDMVSVTGSAFLGLTVGCARCHNHKFDPITQTDYASMTATLAGVVHGERPLRPADLERRTKEAERLRVDLAALDRELAPYRPRARPARADKPPGAFRPAVSHRMNEDLFDPVAARFVRFTITETDGAEPCLDELEILTPEGKNVGLASEGAKPSAVGSLSGYPIHRVEHLNDGKFGNDFSWIADTPGKGSVTIELAAAETVDRVRWSRDRTSGPRVFEDRVATGYRIEVSTDGQTWTLVADSSDRLPRARATTPDADTPAIGAVPKADAARIQKVLAERTATAGRLREITVDPLGYVGQFQAPGPSFRLHRGDPMQPKEQVTPGGIAAFHGPRLPAETPEKDRRLALADWIASPGNPLTARVLVNRLWHYHFGEGIVSTPSDFGVNGARPSHPDLLDWLASELVAQGWSMKRIHRLIVTSSTYRQGSQSSPEGTRIDSGSRLLWRFPPRRLEAETLRDTILMVSGNLDLAPAGGPGFDLFEPNTNYVKVYVPKGRLGPGEWRRMVFQSRPRMQPDGVFGPFDCPDGGQIAPRRARSITPLQALNLLNSPFAIQQAEIFAERLRREALGDPTTQVRRAFRVAFGRDPEPDEAGHSLHLILDSGLTAFCRALMNTSEFAQMR